MTYLSGVGVFICTLAAVSKAPTRTYAHSLPARTPRGPPIPIPTVYNRPIADGDGTGAIESGLNVEPGFRVQRWTRNFGSVLFVSTLRNSYPNVGIGIWSPAPARGLNVGPGFLVQRLTRNPGSVLFRAERRAARRRGYFMAGRVGANSYSNVGIGIRAQSCLPVGRMDQNALASVSLTRL